MNVADILNRAADLIEPEGAWTQKAFARNELGLEVGDQYAGEQVCWCANGAIAKAAGKPLDECWEMEEAAIFLEFLGERGIAGWNDAPERTQAEVVAALRAAAKAAKQ